MSSGIAFADSVNQSNINTFTAGTAAVAGEVNDNFTEVSRAVDDNDTRITALETAGGGTCPADMSEVGNGSFCIDTYEASLFTDAAGTNDADISTCAIDGNDCTDGAANPIFALSRGTDTPDRATWFQAAQACANVGKRLPTNAEWQTAAAGTNAADVDTNCNVNGVAVAQNDAFSSCVSNHGAMNMAGNLFEWVADWVPGNGAETADANNASLGDDRVIGIEVATSVGSVANSLPAAIYRGGAFDDGMDAGEFFIAFNATPLFDGAGAPIGFRCAMDL